MSEVESCSPTVFDSATAESSVVDPGTQAHEIADDLVTAPGSLEAVKMIHATAKVSPNTSLEEPATETKPISDVYMFSSAHPPENRINSSSPAVSPDAVEYPKVAAALRRTPAEREDLFLQEPETTLSLDKEEEVSDLEKSPPESGPETIEINLRRQLLSVSDDISVRAEPGDGDDDSSNDDSSYFNDPCHLPEPGSGRRFSFSSNASKGNSSTTQQRPTHVKGRESDASLSLSEDSDDEHERHPHSMYPVYPRPQFPNQPTMFQSHPQIQFMIPQSQQPGSVPELYPKQLTRMHSYNSLVSSSQNSDDENSPSDTSVRDELQNVAIENRMVELPTPDGRRSPVPMRGSSINQLFASPSTVNPSPPTIHQAYPVGHIPHPQPHSMTPAELAAWSAMQPAARYAYDPRQGVIPPAESGRSQGSDLAYSLDSDSQKHHGEFSKPRRSRHSRNSGRENVDLNLVGSSSRSAAFSQRGGKHAGDRGDFKVYWQRWIMLMYMSFLNLLSDWTCYSVAPIALLTEEAFGNINPEQLVVVFLIANGFATACEPIILSRLGLRRTVLFGALLLMLGSIVKSGGMPPIIQAELTKGHGEWRVYLGFFLVGLSQPLYQCTPALLSASWFPERERTMATGVALNANQLGIGFAFIFGTLLVSESDDIPKYFGLLSTISTITFLGTLIQFDDAPPTPPSDTARVMRGTLEVKLPQNVQESMRSLYDSVRNIAGNTAKSEDRKETLSKATATTTESSKEAKGRRGLEDREPSRKSSSGHRRRRGHRSSTESKGHRSSAAESSARKRSGSKSASAESGLAPSPSPARWGVVLANSGRDAATVYPAPSPMMPGSIGSSRRTEETEGQQGTLPQQYHQNYYAFPGYPPEGPFLGMSMPVDGQGVPYNPYPGYPVQYQVPYWDPQYQQYAYVQHQHAHQQHPQGSYPAPPGGDPYNQFYSYQQGYPPMYFAPVNYSLPDVLPPAGKDEGAEPTLTIKPHQLDIDIRDDQIILSTKACLGRPGFIHSLVAFTVSGIVINTLSTFMDYLVRLNGAGREYTGIVGGSFQFVIMISSLLIGRVCDKTRAYYSITIGMLVLGAFGLAECGVSLDADRGNSLRWALIVVAALVGPLQPVSTELGVDVVYPLSENTVLVIQQLFSNLLSAAFIPCFKAMKDFGAVSTLESQAERPQYTFSFYLLIVLHAAATVFFATFNGRYIRYEHELAKEAIAEGRRQADASRAFHRIAPDQASETVPLIV